MNAPEKASSSGKAGALAPQEAPELLVERRGALGLFTLNRPSALHALTSGMVDALAAGLANFAMDSAIRAVAIRGAGGKAFCAGGDIRALHALGTSGRGAEALDFWTREYRLNAAIKAFPKPYLALIDGIVMGGGVGVSLHGSHRLAGPNYLFAMPEVGIGFFPDVGATYALPRLPGASGAWLAISGARIRREDALCLGLATHAIKAVSEAAILEGLAAGEAIEPLLASHADEVGAAPVQTKRAAIDRHFGFDTLPAIIASLREAAPVEPFAAASLAELAGKSPLSMAIACEQMRVGRDLSFEAAMILEFRIVSRILEGHDFFEGVRALIIDKDNAPQWRPATIEAIDAAELARHFSPLPADLVVNATG